MKKVEFLSDLKLRVRRFRTLLLKFFVAFPVALVCLILPATARADFTATISGGTVTFTGNGASDMLTLGQQDGMLTQSCFSKGDAGFASALDIDSAQSGVQSISIEQIQRIVINGGEGDDTLIINNPEGSVFAPNALIFYNGEGGDHDGLIIQGGGGLGFAETYTPGPTRDAGVIETTNGVACQLINFSGLEPVVDLVPAASLTVNGTNANNSINYGPGSVPANGRVSVDEFETFEFSNKGTLTINGLAGNDTININNGNVPTGLIGDCGAAAGTQPICVNGGDPTASDTLIVNAEPGIFDPMVVEPSAQDSGTVFYFLGNAPAVFFSATEHLQLVGQLADGDPCGVDGTTGNDRLEYFPGAASFSGTVVGTMNQNLAPFSIEVSFTGMAQASLLRYNSFNQIGGADQFIYNGTGINDNITANVGLFSANSISLTNAINGQLFTDLSADNIAAAVIQAHEGDDFISIAGAITIPVVIDGGDPSASDVLNFTGSATIANLLTLNFGARTIQEATFGPVSYSGIEVLNVNANGHSAAVNATPGDDAIDVSPTAVNAMTVRLTASNPSTGVTPAVNFSSVTNLTINGGSGGFDVLGILGSDAVDTVTSTATSVTLNGGTVGLGLGLEHLNMYTFGGNDSIVLTGLAIPKTIDAGAGNDTINLSAALDATILGGPGNDTIIGSPAVDYIDGGDGNDTINGGPGADTLLGGAESDKLIWNPGDGSDVVEGGTGTDELVFNGSAATEIFGITANGARTTLTRNVGAIIMDIGETEQITVNGLDGEDIFNTAPQAAAHITINGGNPVPPALPGDQLNVDLTGTNDSIRTPLGVGAGVWSFSNRQSIDFTGIETQGPADDSNNIFQFSSATASVNENAVPGSATVTVTRTGDLTGAASVQFETSDATAKQKTDYTFGFGTVRFGPGEASKDVKILIVNDVLIEGPETFQVTLSNPSGNSAIVSPATITVTINDDDVGPASNPIDDTTFFVRQHYLDFLGREADAGGLAFWTGQITACGGNASCIAAKRVDVSASFFLSIEFQETGGYALRTQRTAFGRQSDDPFTRYPYLPFMRDVRTLAQGVIVGQPGFEAVLEQNKQAYAEQVVATNEFAVRFPAAPAAVYVDALFASAGVTPTAAERTAAINAFGAGGTTGRVAALRSVTDSASVRTAESRISFVLAEYYGYLRRNPTDAPDFNNAGYQFWLDKLNLFNGNYINAEMVKAFITSFEYRGRFGAP